MEGVILKRRIAKVLMGFVIFLIVLLLLKGTVTKILFVNAVQGITGVSMKVRELHLALLKGVVKAKGIQLMNPGGFPEKMLADIPELVIDLDMGALFQGRTHIEELILNLNQLTILRNDRGELNLSKLRPIQDEKRTPEASREGEKEKKEEGKFQLDYLRLSIERVYYRDYRAGNPPPSREFPIGIQEKEYHDIQDAGDLVRQIVAQALTKSSFAELGDLGKIQNRLQKGLEEAGSSAKKKTQEVLQEAAETLNVLQFLGNQPTQESQAESK